MTVARKTIAVAVALAISCFIIANILVESQPISIVIEDETPTVIYTPVVYGEREVLTLVIASCIAGISAMYLYFETSKKPLVELGRQMTTRKHTGLSQKLEELETVNTALRVLRGPRRRILEIVVNKGGEMLQKDLYLETNFSKAKISRTLRELEQRNIIQRKQYGSTKKIILSDWMKKGIASSREKSEK